jgi:hypothetical protein
MTDADTYALDAIRKWVWSGFYSREDVKRMLRDIVEPGQDVDALIPSIEQQGCCEPPASCAKLVERERL